MVDPLSLASPLEPPRWASLFSLAGPGLWCLQAALVVAAYLLARHGRAWVTGGLVASLSLACVASVPALRHGPPYALLHSYDMRGPIRDWKNPLLLSLESNGCADVTAVGVGPRIEYQEETPIVGDLLGPFVSSNQFAMLVGLGWPMVVVCLMRFGDHWRSDAVWRRWVAVSGVTLVGASALLLESVVARSWAGVVSLTLAATGVLALACHPGSTARRAWLFVAAAALLAACLAAVIVIAGPGSTGWEHDWLVNPHRSSQHRGLAWSYALDAWQAHPWLGIGLGNYRWSQPAGGETVYLYAHNDYLQVAAETGLLGVLALVAGGLLLAIVIARRWAQLPPGGDRLWLMAAMCGLVYAALHASLDYALRAPLNGLVVALLIGTALGVGAAASPSVLHTRCLSLVALALVVMGGFAMRGHQRDFMIHRELQSALAGYRLASPAEQSGAAERLLRDRLALAESRWGRPGAPLWQTVPLALARLHLSGGVANQDLERCEAWLQRATDSYPHEPSLITLRSVRRVLADAEARRRPAGTP